MMQIPTVLRAWRLAAAVLLSSAFLWDARGQTSDPDGFQSGEFVLGPTSPGKWGSPTLGTGATITWSLMATGVSLGAEAGGLLNTHLSAFMPIGFEAELIAAFDAWSAVANLTFIQVVDSGLPFNAPGAGGDIRIGGHAFDGVGGTLAHGYFPPTNGSSAAGDIHFDIGDSWGLGLVGPGFSIRQVAAHEIGHAIGLAHTSVAGSLMNPTYSESFFGPQADDIAGAVHLYGAPISTPDGGSTFLLIGAAVAALVSFRRRSA